jgi:polyhydroxyalkanoate synthesis regulator protein
MPLFSTAMLENLIRFYGNTLQGLMGNYLEKMTQSFVDMQKNLTDKIPAMDHSKNFAPELWSKLVNVQTPLIQGMMDHYLEQSRMMLVQVQQQMVNPVAPPMFDPFAMMSGIHPPVVVKRKPPKNQES